MYLSILRRNGVAIRLRDRETIGSPVLSVVGRVRGRPGLAVHGAVQTLGDGVLGKNIGVEENLQHCQRKANHQD